MNVGRGSVGFTTCSFGGQVGRPAVMYDRLQLQGGSAAVGGGGVVSGGVQ